MKIYLLSAFLLVCTFCFAQQPVLTDDLNAGMDAIVKKYDISNYTSDPVHFNEKINQARAILYQKIKPGSKTETTLRHLDIDYYLRNSISEYRTFHPFGQPMTDAQKKYVDSLIYSKTDLNNEALFKRSAAYRNWVDKYLDGRHQTRDIQNPFIRDYEYYKHTSTDLKAIKNDLALAKKVYQDFINDGVINAYYRDEIRQLYDNYRRMHTAGMPAPDFTYKAVDGKPVTLSSLHGKYVYIDIWATWCGPCKMEIPFLMKLEEGYEGKNIQFVSLSVDKQADAGKWRNYVIDNKLTGHQVMADKDFKSDFIQKFNIAAIPRFILIDPAGNVMDADGKRPSDPQLKRQLDRLLGVPAAPFALSPYARQNNFSGHWQLNKSKTDFGKMSEYAVSRDLNVTQNENAMVVDRTNVNQAGEEKHYSEEFKMDGTSAQTTNSSGKREADSVESNPDVPALKLSMAVKAFPSMTANVTETWTLEDGGKTLVIDRQTVVAGLGKVEIKGYYDKQ